MTLSTTCCKSKSNCIAKNVIEYVFVCVQRYFFNLIYVPTYLCSYEWTLKIHPRAFRSNGFKCRKFKTCEKNILSTYYIVKMYLSLINLFLYNLRWLSNLLKWHISLTIISIIEENARTEQIKLLIVFSGDWTTSDLVIVVIKMYVLY